MSSSRERIPAEQVLVTVGTPAGFSCLGTTQTERAWVAEDPNLLGYMAFDAGLVTVEGGPERPRFLLRRSLEGVAGGAEVDAAWLATHCGPMLRAQAGIRPLPADLAKNLPSDLAAQLPHDLEVGGLRALSGLSFKDLRQSSLRDASGLFRDEPHLGPSLQAQLFVAAGLGALSALPAPLSSLLPEAHDFRVIAGCAFPGNEHLIQYLAEPMQVGTTVTGRADRLAYRLSSSLNTHGPAVLHSLLSPAYNISKARKQPGLLEALVSPNSGLYNVPQAPLVLSGACASAILAFTEVAPQLMLGRRTGGPQLVLWTAADAALKPDARVIEGFGPAALASTAKLAELNAGRTGADVRALSEAVAPFDRDAAGTVLGHGGSGVVVTTLEFAVEHNLDITSIIVGWGQSGETGGKGHLAGVGFGGENSLIRALDMAHRDHGFGVGDFRHIIPHATGTRTNSRTDLILAANAMKAAAERQGGTHDPKRPLTLGTPKAIFAHTMGEAGLRSAAEAIHHMLGEPSVGVPSLKHLDEELAQCAEGFEFTSKPAKGNADGGAIIYAQGFGGYVGAMAFRSANADTLRRYRFHDPGKLEAYLERASGIRAERIASEYKHRTERGAALKLAETHCWRGLD